MPGIFGIISRSENKLLIKNFVEKFFKKQIPETKVRVQHYTTDNIFLVAYGETAEVNFVKSNNQAISNIAIAFEGEIYNQGDLLKMLNDINSKSLSIAEIMAYLYLTYGKEFLKEIKGFFSLAIWDELNNEITLVRDRFGGRPIFYSLQPEVFIFGSSLRELIRSNQLEKISIDPDSLFLYLYYMFVPAPLTIISNVNKLLAGECLIMSLKGVTIERFPVWNYKITSDIYINKSDEFFVEELKALLLKSLSHLHIEKGTPGIFLSGGIDSSLLTAILKKEFDINLHTFTVMYEEPYRKFDESEYAKKVAKRFGTDHHEVIITPEWDKDIPTLAMLIDEPFADPSTIPLLYLSRYARPYVVNVFSGDGGDELFAGYTRILKDIELTKNAFFIFDYLVTAMFPDVRRKNDKLRKLIRDAHLRKMNPSDRYSRLMAVYSIEEIRRIVNPEILSKLSYRSLPPSIVLDDCSKEQYFSDEVTRHQYIEMRVCLPEQTLRKNYSLPIQHFIRVLCPFLDDGVVEFAFNLPLQQKILGTTQKQVLRRLASEYLPSEIVSRPKQGFSTPINSWIKLELSKYITDIIESNEFNQRGLFKNTVLKEICRAHQGPGGTFGMQIWSILILEAWCRETLDVN